MTIDQAGNISLKDVAENHILFAPVFLSILDKDKQIKPLHLNKVQKMIYRDMTNRTIILKGRQQGVSTFVQSMLYRLAITRTIAGLVLSHDNRSTQAFRRMFTRFHEYMPEAYRPQIGYNNESIISFPNTDSEIVVATAGGNGNIGRGFSFTHIHFSEFAFVNDPKPMLAGAIQSGNPSVIIESTANGTTNYFYELCMTAHEDAEKSAWKLLFYQWWLTPEYKIELIDKDELANKTNDELLLASRNGLTDEQLKWRRTKILELGKRLFDQEYPESVSTAFLTSGTGYFMDIPHIDEQLTAPMDAEPSSGGKYIAGLDLGRNNDYTVLSIIDKVTGNEVDLLRINQMSWNTLYERVVAKLKYWDVSTLWIESNNVGQTSFEHIMDMIENDPDLHTAVHTYVTSYKTKPQLVNQFHHALENRDLNLLPISEGKQEIYQFVAKQTISGSWQFKAETGHDDITMARMIAWHGVLHDDIVYLSFM